MLRPFSDRVALIVQIARTRAMERRVVPSSAVEHEPCVQIPIPDTRDAESPEFARPCIETIAANGEFWGIPGNPRLARSRAVASLFQPRSSTLDVRLSNS